MNKELVKKSQEISYALRHRPEEYCLTLCQDGSVSIDELIAAINSKHSKEYLTRDDINTIIATSDKKRFEIVGDMIKAMYGHSTNTVEIQYKEVQPPDCLFHGTTSELYKEHIKTEGIKKMNRQRVHLSESIETAVIVANRHTKNPPTLLYIDAKQMYKDGIKFYCGNDKTWLTDFVDPKYIYMATVGVE